MIHPYIGLRATSHGVSGVVVHIGTASQELSAGVVEHSSCATLMVADGSHKEVDLHSLTVDPDEAAARLKGGAAAHPMVRAVVRYTRDERISVPHLERLDGRAVMILRVDGNNTALCLPMEGGPFISISLIYLEVAPGTDAADVQALYR